MSFSSTIAGIGYRKLVLWQNLDALAENDAYIRRALQGYKRPVLQYASATAVDVENNTPNQHETRIVFPDFDVRTVSEVVASTDKYRRFTITTTAEFTTGTENTGLRSGISEANNTWYAIYAVKSQIDPTKFILVGDTTLPLQANYSTLNTRYGTNSWVYLGMIRNGDNDTTGGDILDFVQAGSTTIFKNQTSASIAGYDVGIRFATGSAAASIDYTLSNGTGATDVPNQIKQIMWRGSIDERTPAVLKNQAKTRAYRARVTGISGQIVNCQYPARMAASEGFSFLNADGNISAEVFMAGFVDSVLGIGFNPVI